MSALFNADEVFEMAIRAEENAAAFYRGAAKRYADREHAAFLLGLAEMEDGHKTTFEKMRAAVAERVWRRVMGVDLSGVEPGEGAGGVRGCDGGAI